LFKKKWFRLISLITILFFLASSNATKAADNYTHDADISRDNTVVDSSFNGIMYNSNPYYIEIPAWNGYRQYSNTTPAVVGNQLWQFTFDDSGNGHLWEIDTQKPGSNWIPGSAVSASVTLVQNFDVGTSGSNGEVNSAAGVSGPTIAQGYIAIAVGGYLYWWPAGHPDQDQFSPIRGNSGNAIQLIAASPLITPPLTATGMDITTGDTVTWQTPFAIVGSWSGGVISQPLYTPDNVFKTQWSYNSTNDATNATNDIVTSSPAWNSHTNAVGTQGAAVFGVDATQSGKNRLILMDPMTGNIKTIYDSGGSPIFYGPIDSSPAIVSNSTSASAPDGTIFVPDQGAGVYQLSANGDYEADDISAMDQNNPCIANIALDGQNVIWVGEGHTSINAAPINMFGEGSYRLGGFNGLNSPAVVNNGTTDTVFLASTGQNGLLVTNPISISNLPVSFGQAQNTWQTLGSLTPAYTSVAADVGTDSTDGTDLHYLTTWTNYGYDTQGCIEIWAPSAYGVSAFVTPSIVDGGTTVQVQAEPYPTDTTASMTAHVTDGAANNFDLTLYPNTSASPEMWCENMTAPENYTGSPDVYTVTVTATSKSGSTATATTNFTVNPLPIPPGGLTGTLKIDALRRNGELEPPSAAKFGNNLTATLTVPTPSPPPGLQNAIVTGASITKAWVHHPNGVPNTTGQGEQKYFISYVDTKMTPTGLTATCQFLESWAGYPPHIPDDGTVMETDTIYAPFSVLVNYKYQVPTAKGFYWATGSYNTGGDATTNEDIIGSDWYTYPVSHIENHYGGK